MQSAIHSHGETIGQKRSALALPPSKEGWLKDALVSLSIANLCFMFVWGELGNLAGEPSVRYFEDRAPQMGPVWALIVDILLLAGVVFLGFVLRRREEAALRWIGTAILVFFGAFAVYDLQRCLHPSLEVYLSYRSQLIIKGALAFMLLFAVTRSPHSVPRFAKSAFLVLSSLFLVMVGHTAWMYATDDLARVGTGKAAGMLPNTGHTNRLIWIIFDELDDRLLFQARPARIHPVEFDRLRQQSIYADHVRTPADDTLAAMPGLFLGRAVLDTKLDTSKLLVKEKRNSGWVDFASQPNVFRQARAAGFNTALSGFHHPYCRILGDDLSDCSWMASGWSSITAERHLLESSFPGKAIYLVRWQARIVPFLTEPPHFIVPGVLAMYVQHNPVVLRYVLANAHRMLRNRDLNFVFFHFNAPHEPGIWDSTKKSFTTHGSNYNDNLELADNILGQVRRQLEATGDWDRSAVIISGDHPYRPQLWQGYKGVRTAEMVKVTGMKRYPYVPFLLKLPGQHKEVRYEREFNNVLTSDLILQLLNGKLPTTEDTVAWLDAHAKISEAE
jgi:sulfatase-like protein